MKRHGVKKSAVETEKEPMVREEEPQEAGGVWESRDQSLCCGFSRKKGVRQGKQLNRLRIG